MSTGNDTRRRQGGELRRPLDAEAAAARAEREILVVEDDLGSQRALTNVLTDRGYRVTAVASVDAALGRLRRTPAPDLIVLDLMMPGRDGWDFRQYQKHDPALAGIPVVAVSAAGKLVDVDVSLRKPLDYDELLRAVERYVG